MPTFDITHRVECDTPQKAVALRDRFAKELDVTVISSSMTQATSTFTVVGVDMKTQEPFSETVEATDPDDAKAKVETATKRVAEVR